MAVAGFVAIAADIGKVVTSNKAAISPDGVSWVATTLPASLVWNDVVWNGTIFCAIAHNSNVAATSPDGVTWTQRTLPSTKFWSALTWNGTIFCAISGGDINGNNLSNVAATSPDGITWTQRTLSSSRNWKGIAWNGSVFCIVSEDGFCATSSNGTTWTNRTLPYEQSWFTIAWNGSVFCVGGAVNIIITSPDGITWTDTSYPYDDGARYIITNGSTFCKIDGGGMSGVSTDNGVTWTQGGIVPTEDWWEVAYTNSIYCTVIPGGRGTATSSNGLSWTKHASALPSSADWTVLTSGLVEFSSSVYNEEITSDIAVTSNGIYMPTLNEVINEAIKLDLTKSSGINLTVITDTISFSELLTYIEITSLVDSIICNDSLSSKNTVANSINEYFIIVDFIFIKYILSISESIVYTENLVGIIKQIENIIESIITTDNASAKSILISNILDLLSIIDNLYHGIDKTISESVVINDIISQLQKFINILTESINISSTDIIIYQGIERLLSSLNISESENNIIKVNNIINESFIISIPTASGQDNYLAYLLSPETNSITNYNNYNFKGCTKFNSKYLFYNNTGLYEYGGTTDSGELIEAHLTTAAFNFGSTNLKQVPSVYLGTSNSDKVYLKVSIDGKANCLYTLNKKTTGLQTQKVDIGKGIIGRYFQFELITKADTFDLESIDFYPIELKRKL
jgi:hypothetical protein